MYLYTCAVALPYQWQAKVLMHTSIPALAGHSKECMEATSIAVGLGVVVHPILWFMKPYPQGSTLTDNVLKYGVGAFNETAFNTPGIMNDGVEVHSNMIKIKAEKSDRGLHPTQKPVKLMEFLISLTTSEGQTVLDPFCGCGTTVVAAINLKRNYIGFEINDEYYSNIIKRINLQ